MSKAKKANRELPLKEAKLFREILLDYENRAYKKGLKSCEAILKKQPDHGETLCMKGIILYNTGKKEEGHELIRKGVALDITSHICWHVKALIHKAERDLEQAMACYIQALKIDKDQVNVIRDLVLIQLQFRHYSDAIEHRINLLRLQPKQRVNWIGLAVVYHLAGDHDRAADILHRFEDMQAGDPPRYDYDMSEIALLHAIFLEEAGRPDDALHVLDRYASRILDRPALERTKARLYGKTGASQAATFAWTTLLDGNSDNEDNLSGFLSSHGFDLATLPAESQQACLALLDETATRHPRSLAIRRAALRVSHDDVFRRRMSTYIAEFLEKGIPSLYVDIRHLYADKAKREIIQSIIDGYCQSLEKTGRLQSDASPTEEEALEPPTTYLWTLYFLAQHYSGLGQDVLALEYIDRAIAHTPSLSDFHLVRARILKRAGDRYGAERSVEAARALDGQDRFLNCKAAKYLCRVDKPEDAEKVAGLFTRAEAASPLTDLVDMQALWFLQEQGEAYRRLGKTHLALKRFHQIEKVFNDWEDDQYDFHSWCLRKYTVRAYLNMVKWEDNLRKHAAFYRASAGAVEVYLEMHRRQTATTNGVHLNGDAEAAAKVAEEERKKAEKKAKKASAKAKAADVKKPPAPATAAQADEDAVPVKDDDPDGHKLAATKEPLEIAARFVRSLERMASGRTSTWILSYRLAKAQDRPLQAIRALLRAKQIDAQDLELHVQLASLRAWMASVKDETALSSAKELLEAPSVEAANAELLQRHAGSPLHILAAARALLAGNGSKADAEALPFQLLQPEVAHNVQACEDALKLLRGELGSSRADEFRAAAHVRYPLATAFFSQDELSSHLEELKPAKSEEQSSTADAAAGI